MPGICGLGLVKKVREFDNKIKIFLTTAFESKDLEDRDDFKNA